MQHTTASGRAMRSISVVTDEEDLVPMVPLMYSGRVTVDGVRQRPRFWAGAPQRFMAAMLSFAIIIAVSSWIAAEHSRRSAAESADDTSSWKETPDGFDIKANVGLPGNHSGLGLTGIAATPLASPKASVDMLGGAKSTSSESSANTLDSVKSTKADADRLSAKAKEVLGKADEEEDLAKKELEKETNAKDLASKDKDHAAELRHKAQELFRQADVLELKVHDELDTASTHHVNAGTATQNAASFRGQAKALEQRAASKLSEAEHKEQEALTGTASKRLCMDFPGMRLQSDYADLLDLAPVALPANLSSAAQCREWCQEHTDCRQSVFMASNSTCQLFAKASNEPAYWREGFNSSICGPKSDEEQLEDAVHAVYKMKPWVPEPTNCAWAGENCLQSKCCANVCVADWQFSNCQEYTCYVQDQYFAGCKLGGPPGGWNGTRLGGHAARELEKAEEGILIQGTSLFCFAVIMWDAPATMGGMDSEGEVANNWKKRGLSIMQCDEHAFFDGLPTGSAHNIDSFTRAWDLVRKDGRYKNHDWVVKVDADAVFFPDRLRWHIGALRTPQGAPVYLRNTFFKFHFLGAIEVLTKEAMDLYYERSWECEKHVGKEGGEDYWLLSCLEGIGVNYQSDYRLLHDKYAADENCNDDWTVAFHFYKKVDDWNWCHDAAYNAWKAKQGGK